MKINNKTTNIIAICLLVLMFGLAFFSIFNDANTMDELAHTPSGYSYIVKQDMRLNPEHPPLLKDLSGLSIWLGSKITSDPIYFPDQVKPWTEDLNGQWDFGREFLFRNNNNADKIIFLARIPMIMIMLLLGYYVFRWTRELYGNKASLLALFLYSLSPAFIANGRLVTTDVVAAAAFFISIYYFIKWIQKQNKKNLIIAGIVFGLALLSKFSLALLIPYFVLVTLIWMILQRKLIKPAIGLALIGIIAMALVWPVYQFHTWNYPAERQIADSQANLKTFGDRFLADPVIWASDKPILRPYAQFFTGLLMVIQRAAGGNTTYFLGEISRTAWPHYFPFVFLIKVPLSLLLLSIIALIYSLSQIKKTFRYKIFRKIEKLLKKYFTEFALLLFFAIYWYTSVTSNLNIGIRHILPTFPVIYILVSGQINRWLNSYSGPLLEKIKLNSKKELKNVKIIPWSHFKTYSKYTIIIILFAWYAFGTIKIYPHFLTYFNELVGGPSQGYKYVTDSNLDWGQDLKRLAEFVDENNIDKIYIDYFGGDSLNYRLGDKYESWWGDRNPKDLPLNSWLAVSATFLQGGRGVPNPEYHEKTGYYKWLDQHEPVTVIGNSIFIYQITSEPGTENKFTNN